MKREEKAWENCKSWVTHYEGAVNEFYLCFCQPNNLLIGLNKIKKHYNFFNYEIIWHIDYVETHKHHELEQIIEFLKSKELSLSVFYDIKLGETEVNLHLIIDMTDEQNISINIIWWPDVIFPQNSNHYEKFIRFLDHIFYLQTLFKCENLYIAPECSWPPYEDSKGWEKI